MSDRVVKYLERLATGNTAPVRVSKKALEWLSATHPSWTATHVLTGVGMRADGGVDTYLTAERLRELWLFMDDMIDHCVANKSRPGVNAAIGMQRKVETMIPSVPW